MYIYTYIHINACVYMYIYIYIQISRRLQKDDPQSNIHQDLTMYSILSTEQVLRVACLCVFMCVCVCVRSSYSPHELSGFKFRV